MGKSLDELKMYYFREGLYEKKICFITFEFQESSVDL